MNLIRAFQTGTVAGLALALTIGCSSNQKDKATSKTSGTTKAAKEQHTHGAGPHGGAIGDWGAGKYHFEFTVSHPKKETRVYILESDEKTPVAIKAKDGQLLLTVKGVKTKDEFEVTLKAEPQKGDPAGKASSFVGTHEKLGVEQEFEGVLTGEDDGTPYRGEFKEEPEEEKKK